MSEKQTLKILAYVSAISAAIQIIGWWINMMEVDAAQYASITLEMLKKGDYLTFTDHGIEYLDKPPLIFWLSGISMKLLGANNMAYRIPAFLATILAAYSTYRFALLYYSRQTAHIATAILITTQAVFLINHDVRTDTNLMTFYIFTIWQLAEYLNNKKYKNLIWGFIGIGMAMLAKGPIGLIAPIMAFGPYLILKNDWKSILNPNWLVGLLITALVLAPMCYGLYQQFDLQPGKIVNGQTGVSGLRFFFWTQSFGRITGESVWDNGASPFFLTHSTLWAFAPWSIFLILGLFFRGKTILLSFFNRPKPAETITFFGFILPFMALSASHYQLPHYAFIVYPLGAIISSDFILKAYYAEKTKWSHALYIFQTGLLLLLQVALIYLLYFAFPESSLFVVILSIFILIAFVWIAVFYKTANKLLMTGFICILGINLALNSFFYPNILKYQAGSELGALAKKDGAAEGKLYSYKAGLPHGLNFYSGILVKNESDFNKLVKEKHCWIYTNRAYLNLFKQARPDLRLVGECGDYPVSMLKLKFINPATRHETLQDKILIKL